MSVFVLGHFGGLPVVQDRHVPDLVTQCASRRVAWPAAVTPYVLQL